MKKLLALIVALMMALTCASAFADTIYTQVAIDPDVATTLLTGFGVDEDGMTVIDPIIKLINALGVKVTTVADGAQIDLDLNGKDAVNLGFGVDEQGVSIVSSLFPSYIVTMSQETLNQFMEQVASNMPGTGEGAGLGDVAAMGEIFGGYFQTWFEACAAAGQPGEPVMGEYEFEGYTFDTMVPITVDIPTLTAATQDLLDSLLADPAAMNAIKGMAQGVAQSSGESFDEENFEANFKAGFEEWMAHFPETAEAEYYCNGEEGVPFYLVGQADREGNTYAYTMLFVDESTMNIGFAMTGEQNMDAGFAIEGGGMSIYVNLDGMYIGLAMGISEDSFVMDVYFVDSENPVLTVTVQTAEGGERTLAVDGEGKTVLSVEEAMSDDSGEAVQGLLTDLMFNGLGGVMGVISSEVPEIANVIGMLTGGGMAS